MPQYQNSEAIKLGESAEQLNEEAAALEAKAKKLRDEANALIRSADLIDAGALRHA